MWWLWWSTDYFDQKFWFFHYYLLLKISKNFSSSDAVSKPRKLSRKQSFPLVSNEGVGMFVWLGETVRRNCWSSSWIPESQAKAFLHCWPLNRTANTNTPTSSTSVASHANKKLPAGKSWTGWSRKLFLPAEPHSEWKTHHREFVSGVGRRMALVLKWPDGASRSGVLGGNGDESFFFLVCDASVGIWLQNVWTRV